MYEYEYIKLPLRKKWGFKKENRTLWDECEAVIAAQSCKGWRFVQCIVEPYNNAGMFIPVRYILVFEKLVQS